jgi:hypothetical protein
MKALKNFKSLLSFLICYMLLVTLLPTGALAAANSDSKIINNNSLLVKEGEWLYYRNSSDGGSIYKIKADGTENTKINDVSSSNISIYGDWIYFKVIDPKDDSKNYEMFRIKKDAPQGASQDLKFSSNNEVFIGDYIYYVKNNDGIYKAKADGSEKSQKIVDCKHGGIRKNYIFYSKPDANGGAVETYFISNLDGKNEIKVGSANDIVKFTDNWIYYGVYKDGLYKMKIDGSEKSKISNDSFAYVLNDQWIHDYNNGTSLFKNIDGSKNIKESGAARFKMYTGDVWTGINMVDNWIYFHDSNYNCLSMVNTDNSQKIKLYSPISKDSFGYDLNLMSCLKDGDYVYYINDFSDSEKFLYKYDINSGNSQRLSPLEDIQKVSEDKKWVVKFDKELDESTINSKNIIVTDGDNQTVKVNIALNPDKKSITISKDNTGNTDSDIWQKQRILEGRQIYNLKISKDVKSKDGKELNKNIVKIFEVN